MKNKILFGKDMDKAKKGMDVVHQAVASTMGAAGKNGIFRSDYSGRPVSSNDGITIARKTNLEDEAEAMGAEFLTQAAEHTNEEAGDGTTTAIVLAHAMVEKGLEKVRGKKVLGFNVKKGVNAMVLKKQMQESVKDIVERIKTIATPIETDEQLFNIANISMENPEIAQIIADSVKKVGENGSVRVDESNIVGVQREDIDGMKFDKSYVTPYMISNLNTMESILEDVHVLVTDKSFQMNNDLLPLLEELNKRSIKKLFIICSGMSGEILSTVIKNRMDRKFFCVAVDKPFDEDVMEDIAIFTGAENVTNQKFPTSITAQHINYLGQAKKIIVDKNSTLIIGGAGKTEAIEERIEAIKKDIKESDGSLAKDKLKQRLARLVGKVVFLKVGAHTEADMKYLKLKVDDAVASTRAALEEGVVIGGGRTLYDISQEIALNDGDEVIKYACSMPMKTIMKNAGFTGKVGDGQVFNALTGKITFTPFEDGIVDPAKVERCALENAVSMAGNYIASDFIFVDVPNKKDENMV
jgi:chaperonin GroEL